MGWQRVHGTRTTWDFDIIFDFSRVNKGIWLQKTIPMTSLISCDVTTTSSATRDVTTTSSATRDVTTTSSATRDVIDDVTTLSSATRDVIDDITVTSQLRHCDVMTSSL